MVDRTVFLGSTTQVMVRLPQGAVVQSLVTNTAGSETLHGRAARHRVPARRSRCACWPRRPTSQVAYAETG